MPLDGLEPVAGRSSCQATGDGESRVWVCGLDLEKAVLGSLEALLSPDEIARAGRFRTVRDRRRFVAGRGRLRQILGNCLGRPPRSLRFELSPGGKPLLSGDDACRRLRFNASGSAALGLVAVRTVGEIGVDVERLHPLANEPDLARRLLSDAERDDLEMVPEQERNIRLLEYWVRKEAIAKALGTGMSEGLERLCVHPWSVGGPQQVECSRPGRNATAWVVRVPLPRPGYVAAFAATRPFGAVVRGWWRPESGCH